MLKLMLLQSLYKVGVRGTCSGGSVATTGWVFVKNLNHFNHLRSVTNTSHFPWASNKNLSFFSQCHFFTTSINFDLSLAASNHLLHFCALSPEWSF